MSAVTIIPPGTESEEAYRRSGAWGSTLISHFLQSPQLAHRIRTGAYIPEQTPAMRFGSTFHHRCDPTFPFAARYRIGPDADRRTTVWKEAKKLADQEQVTLLTSDESAQLDGMHASILANPIAAHLIEGAEHEVGFRMSSGYGPFDLQCRVDLLHRWNYLADFKTSDSLDDFSRSVLTYGYHRQAALYRYLVHQACGEWMPFSFVVVEKSAPLYRCRVFDLAKEFIDLGWHEVEAGLIEIGARTTANDWNDHRDAELVSPPPWLVHRSQTEAA